MELTALALWLNTTFAAVDESVAIAIHKLFYAAPGFFTPLLTFMSTTLNHGGIYMILLSFVLIWFPKTRKFGTAMLAALAVGAFVTNLLFKPLAARPRPYTWDGSVLQQIWREMGCHMEKDKSFPSGHVNAAMAVSVAVFLVGRKKVSWTIFIYAVFVGVSRIYLGVHYFSDVLGGYFVGTIGGVAGYIVCVKVPEVWYTLDFGALLKARGIQLPGRQKGRHER